MTAREHSGAVDGSDSGLCAGANAVHQADARAGALSGIG
jgi:hypothetical protein